MLLFTLETHTLHQRQSSAFRLTISFLVLSLTLFFLFLFFLILLVFSVLSSWHPAVAVALHGLILTGQVNTLTLARVVLPSLAKIASTSGQLGADLGVTRNPVGQCILAVLNNGLGSFVAVVGRATLTRGDRSVIDQLQEVLSVSCNDGGLFTVFTESIELVGESSLQLLAGDVGQLSFGDQGLGFGANEFLFQDDNARAVGFLVLELGNLVGDLLLAVSRWLDRGFNVADRLDGYTVLIVSVDELILQFTNLVDEDTELVSNVANIFVACFTPQRELLL